MRIDWKSIQEVLLPRTPLFEPEVEKVSKLIAERLKQDQRKEMRDLGKAGGLRTKTKRTRLDPNYYSNIGKQGGRGHKKPREENSNG